MPKRSSLALWRSSLRSTATASGWCRWDLRSNCAAAPTFGRTGQLGLFRFEGQGGVAAGVRRIEAITGPEAYRSVAQEEALLEQIAGTLRAHPDQVLKKLDQVRQEKEKLEARLEQLLKSGASAAEPQGDIREIRGVQRHARRHGRGGS